MEVGLALPQLGGHVTRDGLPAFCESAEELGFGSLWVQEHLFYPLHPVSGYSARPGVPVPDAYRSMLGALETLTAAAAWTSRVTIGTSILVAGLHRPVPLAQELSTIDLLSEGRPDAEPGDQFVAAGAAGTRVDVDDLVLLVGPVPRAARGRA